MMVKLILLLCALALAGSAAICFAARRRVMKKGIRTRARVHAVAPLGGNGQMAAQVAFVDADGKERIHTAQRFGMRSVRPGDGVEILYTRRKVLGLDAFNVFILSRKDANPFGIYVFAGALLTALAAACIIVAAVI